MKYLVLRELISGYLSGQAGFQYSPVFVFCIASGFQRTSVRSLNTTDIMSPSVPCVIGHYHVLSQFSVDAFNYDRGYNKKEQLTLLPPPPQKKAMNEGARRPKPAILASLKWGGGGEGVVEMFHSFCPAKIVGFFQ